MRKRMLWTVGIVFFGVVLAWLGIGQAQQPNEWATILKNFRPDVDYVRDEILIALEPRVLEKVNFNSKKLTKDLEPLINSVGFKISRSDSVGIRLPRRSPVTRICGGFIITVVASGDIAQIPSAFTDLTQIIRTYLGGLDPGLDDAFILAPNEGHHMPQDNQDIAPDPSTITFNVQTLPSQNAKGVKVAVLDSGTVPIPFGLLPGIHYDESIGRDFSPTRPTPDIPRSWKVDYYTSNDPPTINPPTFFGHGTPIAGIISSIANNVTLLPIKVCNRFWCTGRSVALGLCWASDNEAQVINLSLGGFIASPVVKAAMRDAIHSGALIVAAAGNTRALSWSPNYNRSPREPNTWNFPIYPAAWSRGFDGFNPSDLVDGIISVGSSASFSGFGPEAWISPFTYFGPTVDVLTYGEQVQTAFSLNARWSPSVGFTRAERSGTSLSAPIISAVAASILARDPNLTPIEVKTRIRGIAIKFPLICYQNPAQITETRNGCVSTRRRPLELIPPYVDARVGLLEFNQLYALLQP
jgi:Subtilase family